ncbi:PA3496 family putative envelope integrity protein [Amphritea sp.]|uniref:PA3496 family putative envelope integrity protein n=1 Tax=Amphritea sp. TaxID=1872502 RepID=UPI003A906B4C
MLIRKDQDLNEIQTKIFDIIVGIEETERQAQQKKASEKSLSVRRAIEERKQRKELEYQINDERWFDDLGFDER